MATYIQGLTDAPAPMALFQPDLGLVQKALGTLQSRYDQGFASVKNAYNQVLNAPISNFKLQAQRDAYVKSAEQQLKHLSSVDLSIPENQSAAEAVFSPFWEDRRILWDAQKTKGIKGQMQQGFAMRDSDNEKEREQYNDIAMLYLQNGLEELQDTDPDSPDFFKIQDRRFVPFKNLEKYLDEQATAQKLEIKWKSPSGPYLVEIKNGQRSLSPFKTWAKNMLGNNFSAQFNVMGTVESEGQVKSLMSADPTLTKEGALRIMAANTMAALRSSYQDQNNEIDESLGKISAKIEGFMDRVLDPVKDQEEIAELSVLYNQKKGLVEQKTSLSKEYDKFDTHADKTLEDIVRNPAGYFANVNKQRVVNGWAAARASIESSDMDLNPAFHESNDVNYKRETLRIAQAKQDLDEREFAAKFVDTDGDGVPDTYMPRGGGSGDGSDGNSGGSGGGSGGSRKSGKLETFSSGRKVGYGITDVTQTGSAYNVFQREQGNRFQAAHDNILSLDGVAYALQAKLHFSDIEVRDFVSDLKNMMADPEHYKASAPETFNKIKESLAKESGIDIKGPLGARNAMVAVAGSYLAEKLKGGGKGMDKADRMMVRKYMMGLTALQAYSAGESSKKDAIKQIFAKSTSFDLMKEVDKDGNVDVVEAGDLVKYFPRPSYNFRDMDSNKRFTLTREELARYYSEGRITSKVSGGHWDIAFDGKKVDETDLYPNGIYDKTLSVMEGLNGLKDRFALTFGALDEDTYGSKYFKKLRERFDKAIAPNLPEFQSKTGKYGVRFKYDLRADKDDEFSYRLMSDLQNADNRVGIYDGTKLANADVQNAVLALLSQGETVMEKYISAIHVNPVGPHGNAVVDFSVAPVKDTDQTTIGGVNIGELAGKNISIELNPDASGDAVRSLRFNSGFYMFGDMLKGKEIKSDAILEAAGFKFSVLPDDPKNPRSATISMQRTVFDDKTGQNKPLKKWKSETIYFDNQTPDDIMASVYKYLERHLNENEEANERYDKSNAGGMTGRDYLKKWG